METPSLTITQTQTGAKSWAKLWLEAEPKLKLELGTVALLLHWRAQCAASVALQRREKVSAAAHCTLHTGRCCTAVCP